MKKNLALVLKYSLAALVAGAACVTYPATDPADGGAAVVEADASRPPKSDGGGQDAANLDASTLPPTASLQFLFEGRAYPRPCPLLPWSYHIFADYGPDGGLRKPEAGPFLLDAGSEDASAVRALLINTGKLPIAYHARRSWITGSRYVPGVPRDGSAEELVGMIAPGGVANISDVFAGGVFALVGSVRPFRDGADVDPRAGEGTIPWPKGDFYGYKADTLHVATLAITNPPPQCSAPFGVF
jgi:hypothetical protein